MMSDLFALPVVSVIEVAARQALLVLDARNTAVHDSHAIAGQHLLLQLLDDDVARPYAVANAPNDSGLLEFLIKLPHDRMPRVLALMPGDTVPASPCIGRGFPFDILRQRPQRADLWLCGVGSGVAPLRAAIEFLLHDRHAWGELTLLYGVRSADELCFTEHFGVWAGLGVRVVPVVSRPAVNVDGTSWSGALGYVQDHLPAAFSRPQHTHALICGLPDMEKATCAALLTRGVGPDRVHRNW